VAAVGEGDPAVLLYTSGTTGQAKGAVLTYRNLFHNAHVCRDWFGLDEGAVILTIAPVFHITGLVCAVLASLAAGAEVVLDYRFDADRMLRAIRARKPSFTIGAITAFSALMNHPDVQPSDFSSFKLIYSGGAPIPVEVAEEFHRRFGVRLHPSYGMTETAAPTHLTPPHHLAPIDPETAIQSVGLPVSGTSAIVVDDEQRPVPPRTPGELLVKGPQVMSGYWGRPQETAEALAGGWMHTGDIAIIDEDGWCYIVDRKKDMICAAGFKIWPREVEEALYAIDGVREAIVVGKPDAYRGETVKAYLSLKPGANLTTDQVAAFVRERLAAYKCPSDIEFVADLPKTATGKLQRVAMRERAAAVRGTQHA
jgi:long-chain acyl-CoA synthetase